MAGNTQVPNNLENPVVLKRFLTGLVLGLQSNPYFSGNTEEEAKAISDALNLSTKTTNILNIQASLTKLRSDIREYVASEIDTIILQNKEDISVIAEQFGTFYDQVLSASWYGLNVKAGGAIAGLEIGSIDPNVETPGDESNYFRIIANNFIVGRAYEDLTQEEKDYLTANNLPAFGTVYDVDNTPIPALSITWDSANQKYIHTFNGTVNFSNISGTNHILTDTSSIDGGLITTNSITADKIVVDDLSAISADIGTVTAGVIYDNTYATSGGASYKMKIDLNSGSIYIK